MPLRCRVEAPVDFGLELLDLMNEADHPRLADENGSVASAGLEQKDGRIGIFGKPCRDNCTG
jgi:hypothetical protein